MAHPSRTARLAGAVATMVAVAAGASVAAGQSAAASPGAWVDRPSQARCGGAELRDVRGLRLQPLLSSLSRAGVEDPAEVEPPHGRPYRSLYGSVNGRTLYATAVRPHSGLHAGGTRLVRRYDVSGTLVAERVTCSKPRTYRFVFADDGIIWSFSGLPRRGINTLIARFAH